MEYICKHCEAPCYLSSKEEDYGPSCCQFDQESDHAKWELYGEFITPARLEEEGEGNAGN